MPFNTLKRKQLATALHLVAEDKRGREIVRDIYRGKAQPEQLSRIAEEMEKGTPVGRYFFSQHEDYCAARGIDHDHHVVALVEPRLAVRSRPEWPGV